MNKAVIIETRSISGLEQIIENHLKMLPKDWSCIIYHGGQLKPFNYSLPVEERICNVNSIHAYNNLLTSVEFWAELQCDKVLIFQSDSGILKKNIEDFMEWDYVGAPWKFQQHGGNGGLSLRSTKAMIDTINSVAYQTLHGNEDIYFSNHLVGKLAPREVCEKFSCETIFKRGTFGYHAIQKYFSSTDCVKIMS